MTADGTTIRAMPSIEPLLHQARREFTDGEHRRDVLRGEWQTMQDDHGQPLTGIRGRPGAFGTTVEGHEIGADLIEMQPGTAFPLHVHPGDHILYGVSGTGNVLIDGQRRLIHPGVTVFIAAEYEHGVGTYQDPTDIHQHEPDVEIALRARGAWGDAGGVFTLLAIGVPHKHVSSSERMRIVAADE